MNLMNIMRQLHTQQHIPQTHFNIPISTRVPDPICTKDCPCCHGGSNAKNDFYLEITEEDTEAMKEMKRYWNSSAYTCQPNYIEGKEGYRILNSYPAENEAIAKVWWKHARETSPFYQRYGATIRAARKISEIKTRLPQIPLVFQLIHQFSINNPGKTILINAMCVSMTVVFFYEYSDYDWSSDYYINAS
jgi:hypothetical protein